jgi:two-component system sensor histidine kinase/response regulator
MDMDEKRSFILIVEDDAELRETLSDILSEEGYGVKTASDGKEALALAKKERFPICLVDLRLPEIDGIKVLEEIKRANPEAYAIIMTAYASKDTAIEALKTGAFSYVEKPINLGELVALVKSASDSYRLHEEKKRAEEELGRYMKELERANRDLEDYTSVVSHDLKAPLRTIQSFSMFLIEGYADTLDEVGQKYLGEIRKAAERMSALIEDLLTLSRVGRKFTEVEAIDLNELLNEVKADLKARIEERGGEVVVAKELPTISLPRVWIKELFTNLIDNGLKFNNSKKPWVEVSYEEREKREGEGEEYLFKVKDNGIGIEEKYQSRIFKLFERLHSQSEYGGTGAGLAICKKIVEELGGVIWVESKTGEGSTFCFTAPALLNKS